MSGINEQLDESKRKVQNKDANMLLGAGLGLGAYVATTAITLSFACPVCTIAAPVLVGAGIYKKIKARKIKPGI